MTPAELAETVQAPQQARYAPPPDLEWPVTPEHVDHRAAMTGLVTLFLVMIGFFAVMTGLSQAERGRAVAAGASMAANFAGSQALPDAPAPPGSEKFREDLEGTFAGRLDMMKDDRAHSGWVAGFVTPESTFFADGEADLANTGRAILMQAANALRRAPAGARHGIEVTLPAAGPGQRSSVVLERAGVITRTLLAAGVPGPSLTVGVRDGAARRIAFVFTSSPDGV